VPVAPFSKAGRGTKEVVILPDHQVGHAREHCCGALRADVRLFGVPGRHGADHPFAVGSAFPPGNPRTGAFQIQFRGLVAALPSGAPARTGTGLSGHRTAGTVGTRHASILPQPGQWQDPSGQGRAVPDGSLYGVRLVIARCSVDYVGRLKAHLPLATRLLLVKADGSVLVHSDGGSYKPLNWMSPPATLRVSSPEDVDLELGVVEQWTVQSAKTDDRLIINIHDKISESSHDLGVDPGLIKDGVEADLQRLLAEQIETLGEGYSLIRREYFTAIGPVDILARDADGATVAIELKRRGDIDGVEQLTRYLELLNRDPLLAPVRGIFAAQQIKPQAKVLANDRGIDCITLDYDAMRGVDDSESRLF
jgi:RecB family endonuclease NucS